MSDFGKNGMRQGPLGANVFPIPRQTRFSALQNSTQVFIDTPELTLYNKYLISEEVGL
jgi:hypothetical protein